MRSPLPRWLPLRRTMRRKAAHVAKMMLCALLVFGLFPGSDELVETVVHLVHDGHLPHSKAQDLGAATDDCCDSGEHGCTPLSHHCACCVSNAVIPPRLPDLDMPSLQPGRLKYRSLQERGPPNAGVKPSLRPPIA
jgi:hypothetical protein